MTRPPQCLKSRDQSDIEDYYDNYYQYVIIVFICLCVFGFVFFFVNNKFLPGSLSNLYSSTSVWTFAFVTIKQ